MSFDRYWKRIWKATFTIKREMEPVLQQYRIFCPLVYQMLITYYLFLSQSRLKWYDRLEFKQEQIDRIHGTIYFAAADELAELIGKKGFVIQGNDVMALAILMDCYATRGDVSEIGHEQCEKSSDDTRRFLALIIELYAGVEKSIDEAFFNEFVCYLSGICERIFHQMPSDEESIFSAKHDGAFLSDLCIDFARLLNDRHGIRLTTAEIMCSTVHLPEMLASGQITGSPW